MNSQTIKYAGMLLLGTLLLAGCAGFWDDAEKRVNEDRKIENQKDAEKRATTAAEQRQARLENYLSAQCDNDSMVGAKRQLEGDIKFTRDRLQSLSATAGGTLQTSLSQQLEGYSVEWEMLNKVSISTCKLLAGCTFEAPPEKDCTVYAREYFQTTKEIRELVSKLTELKSRAATLQQSK